MASKQTKEQKSAAPSKAKQTKRQETAPSQTSKKPANSNQEQPEQPTKIMEV